MTVFAVHATLADEVRPTQAVYTAEDRACDYAAALSEDEDVLAASVVRFALDELGTRTNIGMWVRGVRQAFPYLSDCRTIHGGGRKR